MASPYDPNSYNKAQLGEIKRRALAQIKEEQQAQRQADRDEQDAIRQTDALKEQSIRKAAELERAERKALMDLAKADAQQSSARQSAQLKQERQLSQERKARMKQEASEQARQIKDGKARFQEVVNGKKGGAFDKVHDVVRNSRVSFRDGHLEFLPLVRSLEGVFGELVGPIGLAAQAAQLLDEGMRHAAAEARAFRLSQLESGGTKYEVALGETIGKALGLDGKDVAKEARAFADRITSDPYAQATANRLGIDPDQPGPYGKIDKMEGLLKFLDKLRTLSDSEAIRAARATGTEDFLPLRDLDNTHWEYLKEGARRHANNVSPNDMRRAANDAATDAVAGQDWEDWKNGIFRKMDEGMRGLMPGSRGSGNAERDSGARVTQEQLSTTLQSTNGHLSELNQILRQGMYGGGERARGAVPSAVIGAGWATKQYLAQAHALGAFSL